jgi:hypothetical protein
MNIAKVKLTIGGRTFESGDQVTTPDGDGVVLSADPFADEQILVQFADERVKWYSYRVVEIKAVEDAP